MAGKQPFNLFRYEDVLFLKLYRYTVCLALFNKQPQLKRELWIMFTNIVFLFFIITFFLQYVDGNYGMAKVLLKFRNDGYAKYMMVNAALYQYF